MDLWSEQESVLKATAGASRAPIRSGANGQYGGDWYVSMGGIALCTGTDGEYLAKEIARRWNHIANVCEHNWKAVMSPSGGHDATCNVCGLKRHVDLK